MTEPEPNTKFEGNWPGKLIDWKSEIIDANLHVELPFWIAAPDGKVRIRIADCALDIQYQNNVVGIYRNGIYFRDHRELMQITAEGFPFTAEQTEDLEKQAIGQRHFRTYLTMSVRCHQSIFNLLRSKNPDMVRDAQFYLQSLAHASIKFINELIGAYRRASFDPFVSHVSHWDLPVWALSDTNKNLWHIPMARYPVADELPAADPLGRYRFRTTEGRIREAVLSPPTTSLEELLDAWTCFYRGQFAEAIRKVVTAIEVTVVDLLSTLPTFRQGRSSAEVNAHLARLKFSEQITIYLRETNRQLPGPLTHIAPEVNGIYLGRELENARARRHKIVHESEKVDYEHDGPILQIMETMSWLHGWLRESPKKSDPTNSPWHSANTKMRDVFLLEPIADERGLGIANHGPFMSDDPIEYLVQEVHKKQLLKAASRESLDMAYCTAWAFEAMREPIQRGRHSKDDSGVFEDYWFCEGKARRPIFLISTPNILCHLSINAIACRMLLLKNKYKNCGDPLVIVNHLSRLTNRERNGIDCVSSNLVALIQELRFTVISLMDWAAFVCLLTLDKHRNLGFRNEIRRIGVIQFPPPSFIKLGYIRRVFREPLVVSLVLENEWLSVGDEICIQNGNDTRLGVVESIEVKRRSYATAFAVTVVGVKLDIGIRDLQPNSIVHRILRPRLPHYENVEKTAILQSVDYSKLLAGLGPFPIRFTGYGTYGGDSPFG